MLFLSLSFRHFSLSHLTVTVSAHLPSDFQAARYIELLPPEKRPVAGTEGAAYRRQQMARQLPEHDQDPSKCHELSPPEVKQMQQFVRKYKDEALGVGDVMLPEEMALVRAGGQGGAGGVGAGGAGYGPGVGTPGAGVATESAGGAGGPGFRPGAARAGAGAGAEPASGPGIGPMAGAGVGAGFGPGSGGRGAGAVGAGPLSGPGTGPSAGVGPAGGALGTASTAGAMGVPGAQQAGLTQQNYVRHLYLFISLLVPVLLHLIGI